MKLPHKKSIPTVSPDYPVCPNCGKLPVPMTVSIPDLYLTITKPSHPYVDHDAWYCDHCKKAFFA